VAWRPDHLLCGVTYLPAEVGPYLWHEFDVARTERDLTRIRAAGFATVRVHLAWDVFMPTPRQVDRYRLRDLETLLGLAGAADLQVVPVLFAQSFGDSVLLPRWAVARDRARPGVRAISGGIVEPGGPRDIWDDPLMLEAQTRWLDDVLRAFANHPAVLAWDLGHDPATTCRPLRIAHVEAWAALMGGRVRATQDPCWMTLGWRDVLSARGMRMSAVAPHVDAVGMLVHPQRLRLDGAPLDPLRTLFVARLAQRLAVPDASGDPPPLVLVDGIVAEPVPPDYKTPDNVGGPGTPRPQGVAPAAAETAGRYAGELLERAPEAGLVAAFASSWCDLGPRPLDAPPYDRHPWLAATGLTEPDGTLKPHGEVWSSVARRDIDPGAPAPWPPEPLDAAQWYENLPDAANDVFARFRAEFGVSAQGS
jgi:hypothetical protein